jgi:hypothetical protein
VLSKNESAPEKKITCVNMREYTILKQDARSNAMKRFILVGFAVIFMLVFAGCETTYYSVTITNNSSKAVSYFYNGGTDTMSTGDSKTYQVKAYTQRPSNIAVVPSGTLTVKMVHEGEGYIFTDIDPINLSVANALPFDVTIRAGNYIYADETGKTELLVPEGEKKPAKIYTSRPQFTISADYPVSAVKVVWKITGNTISVTIY